MYNAPPLDTGGRVGQLGRDARAAWASTAAAQLEAFRAPSALARTVDHPVGAITGREFLEFRVVDDTLHAWDLARSIGADEQLGVDLVESVLGIVEDGRVGTEFGITPLGRIDDSASAEARLLDLTGRR